MSSQFLRWWKLFIKSADGTHVLDVSQQRIDFEVRASDSDTPNSLRARIYNLSRNTANSVFQAVGKTVILPNGESYKVLTVHLEAGYQNGKKGTIFQGELVQSRIGAQDNKDTYLDIFAADGDYAYTKATVNQTVPAGATDAYILAKLAEPMNAPQATTNDDLLETGGTRPRPRGKVLLGMSRDYVKEIAKRNDCRWSIQNGYLTLIKNTGYLSGEAVQINAQTGMIGVPEQTQEGVFVRCYLNPLIRIGGLIQLNSADVAQSARNGLVAFANRSEQQFNATVAPGAAFYRVMVAEHVGDTRGEPWFTELTCLLVDQSAKGSDKPEVKG